MDPVGKGGGGGGARVGGWFSYIGMAIINRPVLYFVWSGMGRRQSKLSFSTGKFELACVSAGLSADIYHNFK